MENYIIIDDWDKINDYQDFFNHILFSEQVEYKLIQTSDTNTKVNKFHTSFFGHAILQRIENTNGILVPESNLFYQTSKFVFDLCNYIGYSPSTMARSCVNISYPISDSDRHICPVHVDHKFKHIQSITYLNDSDGDTILYKQKFNASYNTPDYIDISECEELVRVTPKKNRILLFDGLIFHSAEAPTKDLRSTLINTFI